MQCPNCFSEVTRGPKCPRCDWPLPTGAASLPAGGGPTPSQPEHTAPQSVPLTFGQRLRLLRSLTPLLFPLLILELHLLLRAFLGPPSPTFLIILGGVVIILLLPALRCIQDFIAGTAIIREDWLDAVYNRRGFLYRKVGEFHELGTLYLTRKASRKAVGGRWYRVCYSPASKFVWSIDPAGPLWRPRPREK